MKTSLLLHPQNGKVCSSGSFQSGQMGQTVNLLATPSVVRIHHSPLFFLKNPLLK